MIKVTRQQVNEFGEAHVHSFTERMVAHLGERFPLHTAIIGPDRVLRVIQEGITSAVFHGIVNERDVCRFVELMLSLGAGLETAAEVDWMNDLFVDANATNFAARLARLGGLVSQQLSRSREPSSDPALQREVVAALVGANECPFDNQISVDDSVTPCPAGPAKKRLISFSS